MVNSTEKINEFRGKYFFLSNFYNAPLTYNGVNYLNSEAAFQAQKCIEEKDREQFSNLQPADAKSLGRKVQMRSDWNEVRDTIMFEIIKQKFIQNPELKEKLIETGDFFLEEGNTWGDRYWGTVNGNGQNNLGKILMKVRELAKKGDLC